MPRQIGNWYSDQITSGSQTDLRRTILGVHRVWGAAWLCVYVKVGQIAIQWPQSVGILKDVFRLLCAKVSYPLANCFNTLNCFFFTDKNKNQRKISISDCFCFSNESENDVGMWPMFLQKLLHRLLLLRNSYVTSILSLSLVYRCRHIPRKAAILSVPPALTLCSSSRKLPP